MYKEKRKKCERDTKCHYSQLSKREKIRVWDREIEIKGSSWDKRFIHCKLKIPTGLKVKLVYKLSNEILYDFSLRSQIIMGDYDREIYVEDVIKGDEELETYYTNKSNVMKIYIPNAKTPSMNVVSTTKRVVSQISNTPSIELLDIDATNLNVDGSKIENEDVKAGKCIFPFKKTLEDKENFNCVVKNNRPVCATEIDKNGVMIKYGFCDKSTKSVVVILRRLQLIHLEPIIKMIQK